jgi:hypothetical protein
MTRVAQNSIKAALVGFEHMILLHSRGSGVYYQLSYQGSSAGRAQIYNVKEEGKLQKL